MADSVTSTVSVVRQQFAARASVPEKEIKSAESFIQVLESRIAQGMTPTAQEMAKGSTLLDDLTRRGQLFEHSASILAGQEAASEADLEARLERIGQGLERVQLTSDRLVKVLKSFT